MLGRDGDAQQSLERVLALDETSDTAYQILGELHYRSGRVADAIKTYETARRRATNGRDFEARLEEWKQESQLQDGFAHSTGAHFRVLFEGPTDDALARRIIDVLEGAYRNVGNTLRTYPPQTINVLLYTSSSFRTSHARQPGRGACTTGRSGCRPVGHSNAPASSSVY